MLLIAGLATMIQCADLLKSGGTCDAANEQASLLLYAEPVIPQIESRTRQHLATSQMLPSWPPLTVLCADSRPRRSPTTPARLVQKTSFLPHNNQTLEGAESTKGAIKLQSHL